MLIGNHPGGGPLKFLTRTQGANRWLGGVAVMNAWTWKNTAQGYPDGAWPRINTLKWPLDSGMIDSEITCVSTSDAELMAPGRLESEITCVATTQVEGDMGAEIASEISCASTSDSELRGEGGMESEVYIGFQPSAEDIVFSLMDTPVGEIESGITLRRALRALLSVAVGKTSIGTGSPVVVTFRDALDYKDRVVAEMSGSERTTVTLDTA